MKIIPRRYLVRFEPQTHTETSINPSELFIAFPVAILLRTLRQEFVCEEDEYRATFRARVEAISVRSGALIRSLETGIARVPY